VRAGKIARAIVMFLCAMLVGPCAAEARRGIPIVIPGFGGGEQLVKVVELPRIPQLQRPDGAYIDLGYKFTSGGGEWVGHIGSDTKYMPLTPDALQMLMTVAGLRELPPPPERPWSTSTLIWMALGIMALIGVLMKRLTGGVATAAAQQAVSQETRADQAIAEALRAQQAPGPARRASTPAPRGLSRPVGGKPSFGRRG